MKFYVEVLCRCWGVPYKWAVFYDNRQLIATYGSQEEADAFAEQANDDYYEIAYLGL